MDPELRDIERNIAGLDTTNSKAVLKLQQMINSYTNDSTGIGMYPDYMLLKQDGDYGDKTRGRIGKMKEFIDARRVDSLYDANEKNRLDFFRNYMWTRPEDTLGVKGAKMHKAKKDLKSKTKKYLKNLSRNFRKLFFIKNLASEAVDK